MEGISNIASNIGHHMILWVFIFAALTTLEIAAPRERQSLSGRLRGLGFWALWIPVTDLTFLLLGRGWRMLGIEPLISIPLTLSWASIVAAIASPIAGAMVGDFFFYWMHRIQHRWFWPFHAVHHSIRELSAINCYHHVSEALISTAIVILPTSLIVAHTLPSSAMVAAIILLQSVFIHSSSRLHFGPLAVLFVDNRFHRIHHSLERQHFDRNFAAFTPLWDHLFGTAHVPRAREWPATGIAELAEPRTVREWIDLPIRYRHAASAAPVETVPTGSLGPSI